MSLFRIDKSHFITVFDEKDALLITEVAPRSVQVNKKDVYEYIELYNNSDHPISFADYQIVVHTKDVLPDASSPVWPVSENFTMSPGEVVLLWVKNSSNGNLSIEDFRENRNVDSKIKVYEIISTGSGLSNANRGIGLKTKTGEFLQSFVYALPSSVTVKADSV